MYLSLGFSLIELPLAPDWNRLVANPVALIPAAFILFKSLVLMIWQAARERKNWARWVLLAIGALSVVAELHHPTRSLLAGFCSVASFLAAAAAFYLLSQVTLGVGSNPLFTVQGAAQSSTARAHHSARVAVLRPFGWRSGVTGVTTPKLRERVGSQYLS
jgi:hypothetical protein